MVTTDLRGPGSSSPIPGHPARGGLSVDPLTHAYLHASRVLVAARLDEDGRVLVANARLEEGAGRNLLGTPFSSVVAERQRERLVAALGSAGPGWSRLRVGIAISPTAVPEDVDLAVARLPDGYLVIGEPLVESAAEVAARLAELADGLVGEGRRLDRENRRLEIQSATDQLTGLANRRALDVGLASRVDASAAAGRPLAVVMIDLDHFKSVNDTHGHAAGDAVLAGTALTLAATARDADLLARYGGEELVAVLDGCTAADAAAWAERAREQLRVRPVAAPDRHVTASFGVAELRVGETPAAVLARADAALYAAKHAGRDRVVVA